ncbi:MAG: hypothetical protein F6J90_35435 [Moorea sp. SIOASIH]|nr:hypothetical protein [Moorena sp. SIOASIH]
MSIVSICATRTLREQQSAVSRQLYGTGHKPCDNTAALFQCLPILFKSCSV